MKRYFFYSCLIILIIFFTGGLIPISKTPRGIDPKPLFNLQIDSDIDIISILSDSMFSQNMLKYNIIRELDLSKNYLYYLNRVCLPSVNDTIKDIFRGIELYQFETNNEALGMYLDYRKIFKQPLSARIYKEKKNQDNRFFMIYNTIRFDYNHGLPYAIDNDPDLILGFLINKYFISITYAKHALGRKTPDNYINEMNSDIRYVSRLLKDVKQFNIDRK